MGKWTKMEIALAFLGGAAIVGAVLLMQFVFSQALYSAFGQ